MTNDEIRRKTEIRMTNKPPHKRTPFEIRARICFVVCHWSFVSFDKRFMVPLHWANPERASHEGASICRQPLFLPRDLTCSAARSPMTHARDGVQRTGALAPGIPLADA